MFRKVASRPVSWRIPTGSPVEAPVACAGEPTVPAGVGRPEQHEAPGLPESAAMASYQTIRPVITRSVRPHAILADERVDMRVHPAVRRDRADPANRGGQTSRIRGSPDTQVADY